jgi:Protein kinase domain
MLIATHQGGLASPYAVAVLVVVMGHTIAWPLSWKQGAIHAALSSGVYLVGIVAFSDLDDPHARAVFAVYAAVIVAGAIVAAWGGHVMWALKQSVFRSRKLGRHRLQKRIGKGGMGEVCRAEDRALRRQVALKILSPEHGKKPSLVARFEREIHATAAIVHPNVVRIHDWGVTDDGVWYYAMDALDGADLATVVKRCTCSSPPPVASRRRTVTEPSIATSNPARCSSSPRRPSRSASSSSISASPTSATTPRSRMASPLSSSLHGEPTDAPATQVEARRPETV